MKEKNSEIKSLTLMGMLWKFMEKVGSQFIQLIIQIVLARLLLPEEYGLIGLLTIFISISDVFISQGLTTALIQKENADDLDFSSVFFANIIASGVIYFILYISSPLIAWFYKENQLILIMRILSLNVFIGALSAVHNAYLSKKLDFKKSFYRYILNVITQGIVGISMAYFDFGVWALVFSKLSGTIVGTIVLWVTVDWKPILKFSFKRIKNMFSYSSKVLVTNLLNTIFNNIHSLIIGRYYTTSDLGFYQRGQQIPQVLMSTIDGSMSEVLYPVFSKMQSDVPYLKQVLRKSIKTSMYLVLPSLFLLIGITESLTIVLLTEKWLPSVPYMKLACIVCMFWPLTHRNHALNAMGLSKITLNLSLITKALTLAFIFLCIKYGIYMIMIGSIFASLTSTWVTSYFVEKYIGYTMRELIIDILPPLFLSVIMLFFVNLIEMINMNIFLILFFQIITGGLIYVVGSIILKIDSFTYILKIILNIIKRGEKS